MRERIVYEIFDPREALPFYVGATGRFQERAQEHLKGRVYSTKAKIAALQAEGLSPSFKVVARCSDHIERRRTELKTVARRLAQGAILKNPRLDIRLAAERFPDETPEPIIEALNQSLLRKLAEESR